MTISIIDHQKVAILGPEGSFSHELAQNTFGEHEHVLCDDFNAVIESVLHHECDFGLAPLENSNSKTIVKCQLEILSRKGEVFVTDLVDHHVRLHLFSFSTSVQEISEVRSFEPVFPQTARWLMDNLSTAKKNERFKSTSDAVKSLLSRPECDNCAAIGSKAAGIYGVPVLRNNIQTEPNVTVFARITATRPNPIQEGKALLGISDLTESDISTLTLLLTDHGCAFDSHWIIQGAAPYGIFEIGAIAPPFSLPETIEIVERALKKSFYIGSYSGKTITSLVCGKHRLN